MTPADLVVRGATVHTMDPAAPTATALAVRDGLIVAVGDACLEHIGRRTEVVDGAGLVVTPGLIDAHQHPLMGIAGERGVSAAGRTTLPDLLGLLRDTAARLPEGGWVVVTGVEYETGVLDHPHLLDDAVLGRPAYLMLADCHAAVMSTAGLRAAGITGAIDFGDRSSVIVDGTGAPTGVLHEMAAVLHGYAAVPARTVAETAAEAESLFRRQAATGITEVHVLDLWPDTLAVLDAVTAPLRILLAPWALPAHLDETIELARTGRAQAVKFFLDGTIDGGSAWLCHADTHGQSTAPMWTDLDAYERAVREIVHIGLPCFTHAIGDRAVTHVLDVYQRAGRPRTGRHRVEHAEILADADLPRFATLDVVASMQPTHLDWTLPDHSDNWSVRLGEHRHAHGWRCADIAAAGGTVALGSDWPIAGYDPRVIMAGARLRRPAGRPDRRPIAENQAMTPIQALAGHTVNATQSRTAGQIREGFRADLTIFRGDPLTTPADDLPHLPVEMTIVGGRVAHRAITS